MAFSVGGEVSRGPVRQGLAGLIKEFGAKEQKEVI